MNQSTLPKLLLRLLDHIDTIEKLLLLVLFVGLALVYLDMPSSVALVSLFGLAFTSFLMAYKRFDQPDEAGEQQGFAALMCTAILPKVLYISSAISFIAMAFMVMDSPSYKQQAMIGVMSIGFSLVLLMLFSFSGTRHLRRIMHILYRAVPLLFIDIYLLIR